MSRYRWTAKQPLKIVQSAEGENLNRFFPLDLLYIYPQMTSSTYQSIARMRGRMAETLTSHVFGSLDADGNVRT